MATTTAVVTAVTAEASTISTLPFPHLDLDQSPSHSWSLRQVKEVKEKHVEEVETKVDVEANGEDRGEGKGEGRGEGAILFLSTLSLYDNLDHSGYEHDDYKRRHSGLVGYYGTCSVLQCMWYDV